MPTKPRLKPAMGCEWYMVTAEVWVEAGMRSYHSGYLCIGCLEHRLGRQLTPENFGIKGAPSDKGDDWLSTDSRRLADRMGKLDRWLEVQARLAASRWDLACADYYDPSLELTNRKALVYHTPKPPQRHHKIDAEARRLTGF